MDRIAPERIPTLGQPLRQWVLNVPFPLRFLFATEPRALTAVLGIVYRAIATHLIGKAGAASAGTWRGEAG